MVTFHGPMLNIDVRPDGVDEESWKAALISGEPYQREFSGDEVETLVAGDCGGNAIRRLPVAACALPWGRPTRLKRAAPSSLSKTLPSPRFASIAC